MSSPPVEPPPDASAATLAASIRENALLLDAGLRAPARFRGELRRSRLGHGTRHDAWRAASAFDWLLAQRARPASVELLRELHDRAVGGRQFRVVSVRVGAHSYPDARNVDRAMGELFERLPRAAPRDPLVAAAEFHCAMLVIHPFRDGNGRTSRLFSSFLLMQAGLRSTLFTAVEQHFESEPGRYLEALDLFHSSGLETSTLALLRGMHRRSAMAAWSRRRARRLREACARRGLHGPAAEQEMMAFDLRPGYRRNIELDELPWHLLLHTLGPEDLDRLHTQLARLRQEERNDR